MANNINFKAVRNLFVMFMHHEIVQETYCPAQRMVYVTDRDGIVSGIPDVNLETWEAYNLLCGC